MDVEIIVKPFSFSLELRERGGEGRRMNGVEMALTRILERILEEEGSFVRPKREPLWQTETLTRVVSKEMV